MNTAFAGGEIFRTPPCTEETGLTGWGGFTGFLTEGKREVGA
jgi:hypothetical protein